MPIAVDPEQTWDFVVPSERDLPEESQTVFILKPLDLRAEKRMAELSRGQENVAGASEAGTYVLKMGLAGWRNFRNTKGEAINFDVGRDGHPTDVTLGRIDLSSRMELVKAILYRNGITEDEQKN
jgi:hypothetical protein